MQSPDKDHFEYETKECSHCGEEYITKCEDCESREADHAYECYKDELDE